MGDKHDIYYMQQNKCGIHNWHFYDVAPDGIRCRNCDELLDAKPLSAHELIRSIYDTTDNVYYTLCSLADNFGGDPLKEYNIGQRTNSLSSIAFQYPKEMHQLKSILAMLHNELCSAGPFRGIYTNAAGKHLDEPVPAFNLEYYDRLITQALEAFAHKVLLEEGYTLEDAQSYLALQDPQIAHQSFFSREA